MLSTKTISPNTGARKKSKRLGRGNGSGKGTFSWRGMNGQNARSGWGVPDWFEWGQTPLFRRMPKLKGFSNARYTQHFNIINVSDVEVIASEWVKKINKEVLLEKNVIRKKNLPVKLLWKWELKTKCELEVDAASVSAIAAIEKSGWKITVLSGSLSEKKETPFKQEEKLEETPKSSVKKLEADDLTKIEGIGPKIAETLSWAGISSYDELAKVNPAKISEIIADVRWNHVPDTWPEQAKMAADWKWDELKKWQDELDGGK